MVNFHSYVSLPEGKWDMPHLELGSRATNGTNELLSGMKWNDLHRVYVL